MSNDTFTFYNVKAFMEVANVDNYGYYDIDDSFPMRRIHIYSSKREFNVIIRPDNNPANEVIIGKVYFIDDNEVYMIRVKNGVADYNYPVSVNKDTDLESDAFRPHLSRAFGTFSNPMRDVLLHMAKCL